MSTGDFPVYRADGYLSMDGGLTWHHPISTTFAFERASTGRQPEAPALTEALRDAIEGFREHVKFVPGSLLDITVKKWERALASTEAPAETPSVVDSAVLSGASSGPAGLQSSGASEVDELRRALAELLAAMMAEFPAAEAGKEAQEAWADRRAAARNRAQGWLSP